MIDFGGFLGVGSRKLAVHWSALRFNPAEGKHIITLDMTPIRSRRRRNTPTRTSRRPCDSR